MASPHVKTATPAARGFSLASSIPVAEKVGGMRFPTVSAAAVDRISTTAHGANLERVSLAAVTLPISDGGGGAASL